MLVERGVGEREHAEAADRQHPSDQYTCNYEAVESFIIFNLFVHILLIKAPYMTYCLSQRTTLLILE